MIIHADDLLVIIPCWTYVRTSGRSLSSQLVFIAPFWGAKVLCYYKIASLLLLVWKSSFNYSSNLYHHLFAEISSNEQLKQCLLNQVFDWFVIFKMCKYHLKDLSSFWLHTSTQKNYYEPSHWIKFSYILNLNENNLRYIVYESIDHIYFYVPLLDERICVGSFFCTVKWCFT